MRKKGITMDDILLNTEEKMENTINSLENKFTNVRAGRANPSMLDGITVEYYGTETVNQSNLNSRCHCRNRHGAWQFYLGALSQNHFLRRSGSSHLIQPYKMEEYEEN